MRNGYFGIAASILLLIAVLLAFNLIGGLVVILIYGLDYKKADAEGLLLANATGQFLIMAGLPILFTLAMKKDIRQSFRLYASGKQSFSLLLLTLPLTFTAQLFGTALSSIWMDFLSLFPNIYNSLEKLQALLDETMERVTSVHSVEQLVITLVCVGLIPAMSEEIFFRGFLFTNIENSGKHGSRPAVALAITSIAFGISHLSPFNIPGLVMIGALFGWMMFTSGSIYIGMAAHFFNNALIVVILYVFNNDPNLSSNLAGTTSLSITEAMPLLIISSILLYLLAKVFNKIAVESQLTKITETDHINTE
jgi:membrane protease YdiL (CAAX protease family)